MSSRLSGSDATVMTAYPAGSQRWILVIAVAAVSLLSVTPRDAAGGDLRETDVRPLVDTYVRADSTEEQRKEIVGKLRWIDPVLAQGAVQDAIRVEKTRAAALDLASALAVPGLLASVRPLLDTEWEDRAVDVLLRTQDSGAVAMLYKRWADTPIKSAPHGYVADAFLKHALRDGVSIDLFKRHVDAPDDPRRVEAAEIAALSLGASSAEPDALTDAWAVLRKEFDLDAKQFRGRGTDLLRGAEITGGQRIGGNCRIEKGGLIVATFPAEMQRGDWLVRVRLRPAEHDGTEVILRYNSNHVWNAYTRRGEWVVPTGLQTEAAAPLAPGKWTEVVFSWKDTSDEKMRLARSGKVTVGAKTLIDPGNFSGEMQMISVEAGQGRVAVGPITLEPNR